MFQLLTKLGLRPIESAIYEALVASGALSVAAIAEKTGLYRPQIYKYLPLLITKGLVAESRHGKRKTFIAESPRQLERLVDVLKGEVHEHLPGLMDLYNSSQTKPTVHYFEGDSGIRHVFADLVATVKKGEVYYRYESPKNYHSVRKYMPKEYITRIRDKGEVGRYIITNKITGDQKRPRLNRSIKVVPPQYDLFVYDISQIIYGTKVAFVDYRSKTVTLIDSPIFAEFQRKIFKLLFDKL